MDKKILVTVCRSVGITILAYGALCFGLADYWGTHAGLYEEVPFGVDIDDIYVNKTTENIYVGSGMYCRVQVYNQKGEFLRGVFLLPRLDLC